MRCLAPSKRIAHVAQVLPLAALPCPSSRPPLPRRAADITCRHAMPHVNGARCAGSRGPLHPPRHRARRHASQARATLSTAARRARARSGATATHERTPGGASSRAAMCLAPWPPCLPFLAAVPRHRVRRRHDSARRPMTRHVAWPHAGVTWNLFRTGGAGGGRHRGTEDVHAVWAPGASLARSLLVQHVGSSAHLFLACGSAPRQPNVTHSRGRHDRLYSSTVQGMRSGRACGTQVHHCAIFPRASGRECDPEPAPFLRCVALCERCGSRADCRSLTSCKFPRVVVPNPVGPSCSRRP